MARKKAKPPANELPFEVREEEQPKPTKCSVCGEQAAPLSAEGLCWVCRRLKISAWREADQAPAQE